MNNNNNNNERGGFFSFVYLRNLVPVGFLFGLWLQVSVKPAAPHHDDSSSIIHDLETVTISSYIQLSLMIITLLFWFGIVTYLYLHIAELCLRFCIYLVGPTGFDDQIIALAEIIVGFLFVDRLLGSWIYLNKSQLCYGHAECEKVWPHALYTTMNYICTVDCHEDPFESWIKSSWCKLLLSEFDFLYSSPCKSRPFPPPIQENNCNLLFYTFGIDIIVAVFSGFLIYLMKLFHDYLNQPVVPVDE